MLVIDWRVKFKGDWVITFKIFGSLISKPLQDYLVPLITIGGYHVIVRSFDRKWLSLMQLFIFNPPPFLHLCTFMCIINLGTFCTHIDGFFFYKKMYGDFAAPNSSISNNDMAIKMSWQCYYGGCKMGFNCSFFLI